MTHGTAAARRWPLIVLVQFVAIVGTVWLVAVAMRPGALSVVFVLAAGSLPALLLARGGTRVGLAFATLLLVWPAAVAAELGAHLAGTCLQ